MSNKPYEPVLGDLPGVAAGVMRDIEALSKAEYDMAPASNHEEVICFLCPACQTVSSEILTEYQVRRQAFLRAPADDSRELASSEPQVINDDTRLDQRFFCPKCGFLLTDDQGRAITSRWSLRRFLRKKGYLK